MSAEVTTEDMTLEEALLLASIAPSAIGDTYQAALRLLAKEYHKQQLYIIKQGHQIRKLQRMSPV